MECCCKPHIMSFLVKKSQKQEFAFKIRFKKSLFLESSVFFCRWKPDKRAEKEGQLSCDNDLVIENCSTKMKDESPSPFMWLRCLSLSLARCLISMVRYKMWPVDVYLRYQKNSLFICFQFHLNDSSLWSRSCSLSPSISFFISQLQSFIFTMRIAPAQGRPAFPPRRSCA